MKASVIAVGLVLAVGGMIGAREWIDYNKGNAPGAPGIRTEDGVDVIASPQDMWCTELGNCFPDGGDCNRADKGTCTRHENYACLTFTTRTGNDKMLECWKTYGECKTRQTAVERNPELKAIETPCVIFRKGGK